MKNTYFKMLLQLVVANLSNTKCLSKPIIATRSTIVFETNAKSLKRYFSSWQTITCLQESIEMLEKGLKNVQNYPLGFR